MNIFALNRNPRVAARQHFQKHVIKMILESAQMLSAVYYLLDETSAIELNNLGKIYKKAYSKHPCTIWASTCLENFLWLCELAIELSREHRLRYPKSNEHKSMSVIKYAFLNPPEKLATLGFLTEFAQAMPIDVKNENSIIAYRQYYHSKYKEHLVNWGPRQVPLWWENFNFDSDYPPLTQLKNK